NISYPVLSFNGEIQTVIFATFEVGWLQNWQNEIDLPTGAAVTLIAPDSTVLWRTISGEPVPVGGLQISEAAWYSAAPIGTTVVEGADFDGVTRLNTLTLLENSAILHLGYPVREIYAKAYENLRWKLVLMAVVIIGALILAWWVSERSFLRPFDKLLNMVKRLQAGDLSARVTALSGMTEINELGRSFNQMTDSLQQRETERRQLEERFRAAFETSAIGMGLVSLDGRILAANAAAVEMIGYTEAELIQRSDSQNVVPEDRGIGQDLHAEMLAGKRNFYTVEKRYIRKNGELFWTQLTLSMVHDSAGKPDYLLWLVEDIDQRKRAVEELRESEARFKAIYENAAIGISLIGPKGNVIAVNPVLVKLCGYTEAEL
ncbi:PAS domain S-box protein, partial [bacterium]|nr:PAS domain S-box protein [bacterium]